MDEELECFTRDRAGLFAKWQGMQPYRAGYLEGRGLTLVTISKFAGHLRTDQCGNTCFRHDDEDGLSGWEVKNEDFTDFAEGGKKALFVCQMGGHPDTPPPVIVVTESAIDAMSYYQLTEVEGLYISFAEGLSPEQRELLCATLIRYPAPLTCVAIATDNNPEGKEYANIIRSIRPDALRAWPAPGEDWNDTLKSSNLISQINPSIFFAVGK